MPDEDVPGVREPWIRSDVFEVVLDALHLGMVRRDAVPYQSKGRGPPVEDCDAHVFAVSKQVFRRVEAARAGADDGDARRRWRAEGSACEAQHCCGLLLAAAHAWRGGFLRLAAVLGGLGGALTSLPFTANTSAYE